MTTLNGTLPNDVKVRASESLRYACACIVVMVNVNGARYFDMVRSSEFSSRYIYPNSTNIYGRVSVCVCTSQANQLVVVNET